MDLETLGLKQLQATTIDCNMAFATEMQLHSNMTSSPHDTSCWKLMTTSNFTFVGLIKKFPSKELGLLKAKRKDALFTARIEVEHVVTMNWQPPLHPLVFLKRVPSFFGLLPYMLHQYDSEKDNIDGFKSKLQQYKKFKNNKWDN
jgi:hypothetical protein